MCVTMDKCRNFSQHLFGGEKGFHYQLLDSDEMMRIEKSKVVSCCFIFGDTAFWCLEEIVDWWIKMEYI